MKPLLLVALLSVPAVAQHHAPAPKLNIVTLDDGVGNARVSVSTKNAEAQRWFDQGMRYVYAFNHDLAVRSFRKAAELDPALAMAHWGVALALGPNINLDVDAEREQAAWEAVQEAKKRLDGASPKERDLIGALARRYTNDPNGDLKALAVDYSKAMAEVAKKYPDDADIATLYAESLMDLRPWKFWSADGKPAEGTEEIVRVLEGVLAKAPHHVGANHYYIHAVEASSNAGRALASAKRLETLAPAAGHLVHMPAHIYQRTGDYAGAARANEAGAKADRAHIEKYGAEGVYPLMYYNHNLYFGALSHAMQGRYGDAKRLGDEFTRNIRGVVKEMPMVEIFLVTPQLLQLRFGRWTDVIRAADPSVGVGSTAMWHFARGVAFARLGNVAGAESEQKKFEAARSLLSPEVGMALNSPRAIGVIASYVLAGRIAAARGDHATAVAALKRAVEEEDRLNYNEPPDWFYPVRETLGATLLQAGAAAEAEAVFREDLLKNPHNPRSLLGLLVALRTQKKNSAEAQQAFAKAWENADVTLLLEDL